MKYRVTTTNLSLTVCDDGMRVGNPLCTKGEERPAGLVLVGG